MSRPGGNAGSSTRRAATRSVRSISPSEHSVASARELLEQADALMRRNRSAVVDTKIPELTDMVAMVALAPAVGPGQVAAQVAVPAMPPPPATAGAPTILDDVPE